MLTGAAGLLGTWLRRTLPVGVRLITVTHRRTIGVPAEVTVDLRDAQATEAAVRRTAPELIVHAAYDKDEASIVDATRHVARAAAAIGAGLLYVSTDAVFSGDGRARAEDHAPDPIADYGRWKAAAEQIVRDRVPTATIVRLPLVVSVDPDDESTAGVKAGADGAVNAAWFTDEYRQPAMASELAPALWRIAGLRPDRAAGVWHLPGPELLSRAEIASRTALAVGRDPATLRTAATPPGSARPRHLHLTDERARTSIAWSPGPIFPPA